MLKNPFLKIILFPFYLIYLFLINFRNFLYTSGFFRIKKLNKPVISIGNLTAGGTGKTPFAIYLAEKLVQEFGLKPCILSRGYKRKNESETVSVEEDCPYLKCGDEPVLIKKRLKDEACVIVGKNRYKGGLLGERECKCDVHILDDGFQHRKLYRDIDICLLDCTNPFGNGKLLPYGILREPVFEIKRADIVILTRSKYGKNVPLLKKTVSELNPHAVIFEANLEISHFYQPAKNRVIALEDMQDKTVISFSAIGNPLSFKADLITAGLNVLKSFSFPDHTVPSPHKLETLNSIAFEEQVDFIVATEKDWIKLREEKVLEIFGEKLTICISSMFLSGEKDLLKFLEVNINDKRNN